MEWKSKSRPLDTLFVFVTNKCLPIVVGLRSAPLEMPHMAISPRFSNENAIPTPSTTSPILGTHFPVRTFSHPLAICAGKFVFFFVCLSLLAGRHLAKDVLHCNSNSSTPTDLSCDRRIIKYFHLCAGNFVRAFIHTPATAAAAD